MASDPGGPGAPAPAPAVLLDANVLYPNHLRNLLVQLGADAIIAPRWTARIHDEWIGNLVKAGWDRARLLRTRSLLARALPAAEVTGYEHRIPGLQLPDPDDRHVLAAALEAKAALILTFNLRDFPTPYLRSLGVGVEHPDTFLCGLYDADAEAVHASAEAARANLTQSAPTFDELIRILERQGLPEFAARLLAVP